MAAESKREFRTHDRWLNFALVLAPAAWLAHLNISYAMVPESCADGSNLRHHVATAVCLLVALAAAAIAWSIRGRIAGEALLEQQRTKWMATFIVVLSLSMAVVIVAQEIPNLVMGACD
jgi:hypothetical protein